MIQTGMNTTSQPGDDWTRFEVEAAGPPRQARRPYGIRPKPATGQDEVRVRTLIAGSTRPSESRGLRRRLLLARLSLARHQTGEQRRVLAEKTFRQSNSRSARDPNPPREGLASASPLGARADEEKRTPASPPPSPGASPRPPEIRSPSPGCHTEHLEGRFDPGRGPSERRRRIADRASSSPTVVPLVFRSLTL